MNPITIQGFKAYDLRGTAALIKGLSCEKLPRIGHSTRTGCEAPTDAGIEPVIPPKFNRRFASLIA